mmetsp:Transcript_16113/g.41072  ORF Transcript_16113/g.41072 Transcript_16113/m.41072 type:complete len:151 (-) Transcript_16113:2092-2544(-)
MRRVGMTACMGSIAIGALLYTDQYPELPMAVLYLLIPLSALVMRWVLFHEHSIPAFLYTMCLNFILASLVSIVIWLVWITDDNYWTTANKDKWSAQLGCESRSDMATSGGLCRAVVMLCEPPELDVGPNAAASRSVQRFAKKRSLVHVQG